MSRTLAWRDAFDDVTRKDAMNPAQPVLLDARIACKGYAERTVLPDVALQLKRCGIVCLVGSSGCGKSTLLRIVAGLERDYRGSVMLDGVPLDGTSPRIGMIFQEPRLLPWLIVADNDQRFHEHSAATAR
ncbi:hypothetical protein A9R05_27900 [Burkholderia sp. KK1]|nr:hypothetical protein A9R05_27900 [Burkholderia sp. KK1]